MYQVISTSITQLEDNIKRFQAYGWSVCGGIAYDSNNRWYLQAIEKKDFLDSIK